MNIDIGSVGRMPGETSVDAVKQQLAKAAGAPITVTINSDGGSVFEGLAIFDTLAAYPGQKKAIIANAFSMGSVIAMAFDDREITPNGYLMIHNPMIEGEDDHHQWLRNSVDGSHRFTRQRHSSHGKQLKH